MSELTIQIRTGARLHFGLWELAPRAPRAFGGLGLMVQRPGLVVVCRGPWVSDPNVRWECPPDLRDRCRSLVVAFGKDRAAGSLFPSVVEVRIDGRLHSGLGGGTQLACSVCAGLLLGNRSFGEFGGVRQWRAVSECLGRETTVSDLIRKTGRGKRSWIGTAGFLYGGLIVDEGAGGGGDPQRCKSGSGSLHVLGAASFPNDWPVLLLTPPAGDRVFGRRETELFRQLGREENPTQTVMQALAQEAIAAATKRDFDGFCLAMEEYMVRAGKLFAPVQGGIYNGPAVADAVALGRSVGLRAVGQSSWGPTVFGFAADPESASAAARRLLEARPDLGVLETTVLSRGATCRWLGPSGGNALPKSVKATRW